MKFSNESHRAAQWHTNIQWKKPRDHPPTLCRQILSDNSNNNHFHLRAEEHPARVQGEAAHSHNDDSTVWVVETDYINSLSRSGKL